MKIKILSIKYHRNGVRNRPFTHAIFKNGEDTFNAVLFGDKDDKFIPEEVCVFTPDAPFNGWRGDDFAKELIEAIVKLGDPIEYGK